MENCQIKRAATSKDYLDKHGMYWIKPLDIDLTVSHVPALQGFPTCSKFMA